MKSEPDAHKTDAGKGSHINCRDGAFRSPSRDPERFVIIAP